MTDNEIKNAWLNEIHKAEDVDSIYCGDVKISLVDSTLIYIDTLQAEIERLKQEYDFTREYIHDNGLEWDLLSKYISRNGG